MTSDDSKSRASTYTCNDYREEMILLGLNKQLARPDLTDGEREHLLREIARIEKQMGL